jgi:hypothetical protein
MAIIWFSDADRQRMREEAEQHATYLKLYMEFIDEVRPHRIADRNAKVIPRIETLDVKPRPAHPDEEH